VYQPLGADFSRWVFSWLLSSVQLNEGECIGLGEVGNEDGWLSLPESALRFFMF